MGSLIILAILASGFWLSYRGLGLRGAAVFAIGPAVAVLCSLFSLTLMLQSGLHFKTTVWLAPLPVFLLALCVFSNSSRPTAAISSARRVGCSSVWLRVMVLKSS